VKAEPANAPPARPTPGAPGGNLPTPAAGALEGTLSCAAGAPLLEPPEPGDTAQAPETPSVPFSFGGLECTGPRRYPVTALFTDGVEDEIAAQTGWGTLSLGPDNGRTNALKIGADCVAQGADYASSGSTARYHMPLWSHPTPDGTVEPDGVTALATPYRETQRSCGWGVDSHKSSSPKEPSGFDKGRRQLSQAYRPNAVMTVYWGNSRSTLQCSDSPTTTVASASNGVVAFQAPLVPFGYNELWHIMYRVEDFENHDPAGLAADGGSNSARIPLNWSEVEPDANNDLILWGDFKDAYDALIARGIHPIIAIYDAPDWADDPPGGTACGPTNHLAALRPKPELIGTEWRELVAAAATDFSQAAAIEIWNEPNLRRFWSGCDAQPGRYAQLLRHGYEAVKGVDQDMPVITAGMAPDSTTNWKEFLRDVDDFLTGKFWDGLGLHPYRSQEHKANDVGIVDSAIRQFRAARHLGMGRRVWVTEVGVTTFGPWSEPHRVGSPEDAAFFLTRIYERLRDRGAESVIIQRLRDRAVTLEPGLDPEPEPQKGAGVLYSDFACKPVFFSLAAARQVTADCVP
jgi:hypothetical protein